MTTRTTRGKTVPSDVSQDDVSQDDDSPRDASQSSDVLEPASFDRTWYLAAAAALARHPSLWSTTVTQIFALARPGWWRRSPFLPLPDATYLQFRLYTAYGDDCAAPSTGDLIAYLHWCKTTNRMAHS